MSRYRPVFVGYSLDRTGANYIAGCERILLAGHSAAPALSLLRLKAFGGVPRRWLAAMSATRPAVIHAHFGTNAGPAIAIAHELGIPVLVTHHGVDITTVPRSERERLRRLRVFESVDCVIAVSKFIADRLREAGCPDGKIALHYIGVDTAYFSPGAGSRSASRVLFAGRLVPKKGLVHLICALQQVRRSGAAAELVVAGDGPLRAEMEREAGRRGVPATFLGVRTPAQIRDLMREATLLCGPGVVEKSGNAEGLPITFLEAQATGLPVVASTSGGSAEGVVHGETGFLHAPGDEAALAHQLGALLTDANRRRRFSAAARAHILRNFDLRSQTAALESIYDSVRTDRARG